MLVVFVALKHSLAKTAAPLGLGLALACKGSGHARRVSVFFLAAAEGEDDHKLKLGRIYIVENRFAIFHPEYGREFYLAAKSLGNRSEVVWVSGNPDPSHTSFGQWTRLQNTTIPDLRKGLDIPRLRDVTEQSVTFETCRKESLWAKSCWNPP